MKRRRNKVEEVILEAKNGNLDSTIATDNTKMKDDSNNEKIKKHVMVFVLGDLGHSPRMQYHSLSIARMDKENNHVDFIGLLDSKPYPEVLNQENIKIIPLMSNWWNWVNYLMRLHFLFYLLFAPIKVFLQFLIICCQLIYIAKSNPFLNKNLQNNLQKDKLQKDKLQKILLIQTPPAIPTLFLIWFLLKLKLIKLDKYIIDWHNYGYSILNLNKKFKPLVGLAKYLEFNFISQATHHLCVSNAMKSDLMNNQFKEYNQFKKDLNNKDNFIRVMYDRPPEMFKSEKLNEKERNELFKRAKLNINVNRNFKLLVSSTSWTEDEDFSKLLKSIIDIDNKLEKENNNDLYLEFIITGKGPQKEYYLDKISKLGLKHCQIQTVWLEAEDYPKLLSICDLGICLHYSSSKLDLPMKVVDMFGSNLPVLAIEYETISELVKHGENGYIFKDSNELTEYLEELFLTTNGGSTLNQMKQHLKDNFDKRRWNTEWNEKISPLFV
ncbi:hypothetical protein ABK040_011599 [Willaertia magna]